MCRCAQLKWNPAPRLGFPDAVQVECPSQQQSGLEEQSTFVHCGDVRVDRQETCPKTRSAGPWFGVLTSNRMSVRPVVAAAHPSSTSAWLTVAPAITRMDCCRRLGS